MPKKRVLVLFPTQWDAKQLASCRAAWQADYEVLFAEPTLGDCPEDLDVLAYISATAKRYRGIDGVFSSSDYPGATVASAIGAELSLPSPPPESVLRASHKYYSRLLQREAAPEATPDFWLVDTRELDELPDLPFPVFVKPVKGSFSVHSKKIAGTGELRDFLGQPAIRHFTDSYLKIFNDMVTKKLGLDVDGHFFLVESFLHGVQVTVEGFVCRGRVEIYGIVDSVMHKDTGSFARFDYPSGLRDEIQAQMAEIAARVVAKTDLDNSAFNVEMIYDAATDDIRIIEINPRICGQFGDLYAKVDGRNSYVYALHVATGASPERRERSGDYRMATSYPRRVFEPVTVVRAPDDAAVARVESLHADTLVWMECETGLRIDDFSTWEDGVSARYAVINLGAQSRRELGERLAAVEADLDIRFERPGTAQGIESE